MDKGFGKYDVYAVVGSIYCYRDSNVLKNRFGLRDGAKLRPVGLGCFMGRSITNRWNRPGPLRGWEKLAPRPCALGQLSV